MTVASVSLRCRSSRRPGRVRARKAQGTRGGRTACCRRSRIGGGEERRETIGPAPLRAWHPPMGGGRGGAPARKAGAATAWRPLRTSLRRHSEGAGPDLVRGAMSRPETGANASSWVAASRRDEALPRAPDTRPAEEPSQGGGRGQRTCAGGGQRGSFGLQQPEGAGIRVPPLSFKLKNDCVGAVIGESVVGRWSGRGGAYGTPTPPTSPPVTCQRAG